MFKKAPSQPSVLRIATLCVSVLAGCVAAFGQAAVTTQHNDAARTGANLSETTLNTSNVDVSSFGKLFTRSVDDQIYCQPLYVPAVTIPGKGVHNVVYVATVKDSVYAFDADDPAAAAPLWQASFVNAAAGIVPIVNTDVGQTCGTYRDFSGNIGIVGTPVIDAVSQTLYVVARTKENGTFVQRLHALDSTTGAERSGSPVLIQATMPGTGDGHDAQNNLSFNARTENQRPALLLLNGVVYIAWASHCDQGPYHGWVLGYNATTLQQVVVYNTSPNGGLGGIWQAGQGPAADANGNIYFVTGNGTFDGTSGTSRGNCFVKLSPTGSELDWFAPYNWSFLNSIDADLGSSGAMLIPDTNLVVGAGKQGVLYVVSRTNMGHVQSGSDSQIVQSWPASTGGRFDGSPIYWNSPNQGPLIYIWADNDPLKAFRLSGGLFQTTPVAQSAVKSAGMPGGLLSLSANGSIAGTGIVWAAMTLSGSANQQTQPGILRAYDAGDVTHELWNSQQNAARDAVGSFAKFSYPTVANGKVYVATFSNQLVVYGLLNPSGNQRPVVSAGPDQTIMLPSGVTLNGSVSDDGLPNPPAALTKAWSTVSGPGSVTFANPNAPATTATFSAAGTYVLRLTADDSLLSTSDDVTIVVYAQGTGGGTGLRGQYYNDAGNGIFFTTLALTRTDATVDFDWANGSPAAAIQADNFSARWMGQIQAPVSGDYTFYTTSDDGVRLWVNGQLLVDKWIDQSPTTWASAPITLVGGQLYDVRMEFYERGGTAVARLMWSFPGQGQVSVPQSQLFPPSTTNQQPLVSAGPDLAITLPAVATLAGGASDDGLPSPPATLAYTWRKVSGREDADGGQVIFGNPNAAVTTATFSAPGTYVLRLTADDGALTGSDDVTVTVSGAATGTGLTGQYYNDTGNRSYFTTLRLTRTDATVDFNWASGSPGTRVTADNFSVRWTGSVQAPASGAYTFATRTDDGVRLWIGGQLVVDNWTDHSSTLNTSTPITLAAGRFYDVKMEFYERGGSAEARLLWSYPGQAQVAIPKVRLYPATGTGLTGAYYNNADLTSLVLTRLDSSVNFTWGSGSPASSIGADTFSVRWTGKVQPRYSEVYTFYTTTNDGVRLWVNGQLVVNKWVNQSATWSGATSLPLEANQLYEIKMEYYDNTGSASAKLEWSSASQTRQVVPAARLFP